MPILTLYDRTTLAAIPWPATPDGDYARRVLEPLVREGTLPFIANVDAEVRVLVVGDVVVPVVINAPRPTLVNSYVTSPTTHYIRYAKREVEIELHAQTWLRRLVPPLLDAWGPLLRWSRFERVVYINNWLLSTNLYVNLDPPLLRTIRDSLIQHFPGQPLIFRSVNETTTATLYRDLQALDFRPVFSRQTYLLEPERVLRQRTKDLRSDQGMARRTPHQWRGPAAIAPHEYGRLRTLYDDLYLAKYSHYNPQFTDRFMQMAVEQSWLHVRALDYDGVLNGVLGYVERGDVLTTPIVGYDRHLPQKLGLYRLITLKLIEEGRERGKLINLSSGAASFKRNRGATSALEYNLVYDRHCLPRIQLPWRILEWLSQRAIIPVMRRYGL